jgi:negative regulator of sigma E activity
MTDDELTRRITGALDEGTVRLDGSTRSRLAQARQRALAAPHARRWVLPATGGAVLASVVAAALWLSQPVSTSLPVEPQDLEMLTAGDRLELYQELDFLRWLEEMEADRVG